MGSKGFFCFALCLVGCGESSSSHGFVGVGTAGVVQIARGGSPGAGGTDNGGARNGDGGATTRPCQSDRECTPFRMLCDHARSVCVECLVVFDCAPGELCRGGVCEAQIRCSNSLDCVHAPSNRVICDQAASNCVECVTTADCAAGVCEDTRCTTPTGAGGASNGGGTGTGGTTDTGGSTSDAGGSSATGGSTNDTGGSSSTGGAPETGGFASTGGWPNTGGFQSTGGFWFTGGYTSTGGFTFTGGFPSTGGRMATGGFTSTGGRAGTGGAAGTGGSGTCVASQCPVCSAVLGQACCTTAGMCGCTYLVPGYCL